MSYSHLRGCWFSEMPQVRCHVHRSPGSKLRPLCFFPDMPPSSLALSLSISSHANTLSCDFIYAPHFSPRPLLGAALHLLLWGLTRLVPYFSLSVITEQSRRYRFEQQHFMKAIQYSQCEYVRRPGSAHLIISPSSATKWERERRVIAQKSQGPGSSGASITMLLFLKWLRCALS